MFYETNYLDNNYNTKSKKITKLKKTIIKTESIENTWYNDDNQHPISTELLPTDTTTSFLSNNSQTDSAYSSLISYHYPTTSSQEDNLNYIYNQIEPQLNNDQLNNIDINNLNTDNYNTSFNLENSFYYNNNTYQYNLNNDIINHTNLTNNDLYDSTNNNNNNNNNQLLDEQQQFYQMNNEFNNDNYYVNQTNNSHLSNSYHYTNSDDQTYSNLYYNQQTYSNYNDQFYSNQQQQQQQHQHQLQIQLQLQQTNLFNNSNNLSLSSESSSADMDNSNCSISSSNSSDDDLINNFGANYARILNYQQKQENGKLVQNYHETCQQNSNGKRKRKRILNRLQRAEATMREKRRMLKLNKAFEELRKVLPISEFAKNKLSRAETLKSAIEYIERMSQLLSI